jgi:AcrR family transcriptional regulator
VSGPGRPSRTGAEDWAQAALDEIEAVGVDRLSVEAVARRLGVSKGGFYHQFADRRALLRAALARWESRFAQELSARFEAIGDPGERLHAIFAFALLEMAPTVILRLMAAAEDPDVAATLTRATERRLALLRDTFSGLGLAPVAAQQRAVIAYSAYLGLAQLRTQTPGAVRTPEQMRGYLADLESALRHDLP